MAAKDTKKAIRADIEATTLTEEMKLMYLLAGATQSVVEDVMNRLRAIYRKNGLAIRENEMLSGLNDFCRCVRQAGFHYYNRIDNHVINCTWGMGRDEGHPDADGDTEAYDGFMEDQLEVVRLVMLYVDRTARNAEAFGRVFGTLRRMSGSGIFTDADISRFKIRKSK